MPGVPTRQLRSIGVGIEDSPESWNAIQRAAALGVAAGATLRVIHALYPVIAPPMVPKESERLTGELRASGERALNRAATSVSKDLRAEITLLVGDPVLVLEHEASRGLDLLVLGARGYGPLRRVLLGSVSPRSYATHRVRCWWSRAPWSSIRTRAEWPLATRSRPDRAFPHVVARIGVKQLLGRRACHAVEPGGGRCGEVRDRPAQQTGAQAHVTRRVRGPVFRELQQVRRHGG
jgi:nucleotide-binding universal stress UspA family protein